MEPYKANLTKKSFNEKKSLLKKVGLRGTLMFYFLALALIPLLLVSVLSYQNAKISLRDAAEESLVSIGRQKTREIRTYFNSMLTDLDLQAGMQANSVFLEALTKAMHESGQSADDFTKSYKCKMLVEEMGKDLKSYTQKMGYYDLFLIDSSGNILFSSSEEKALGITLFNEEHSGKKFSAACKKTLLTGQPAFSDYETFEFSGNKVFGFMASVILNEAGDKIGLIALQFPINPIDEIIHAELDKNSGTLIYLVGSDKTLRSHLKGEEEGILKTKVQHGQIAQWELEIEKNRKGGIPVPEINTNETSCKETVDIYQSLYGKHVLGIHRTFDIQGVPFSLIAEIEESAAYSAARKLAVIVYSLLFITILAVVFIALFASRKLVSPIQLLSKGAKMVAGGQLEHEINIEAENEIGELAASFNEMLSNLHRTTEENKAQNRLMTGQAELNAIMRGELKIAVLATSVISYLAQYLDAQIGAIYMSDEQSTLNLIGSYAYTLKQNTANSIQPGEGLIGQVALEKKHIIITDCPDDYINIQSGLGESVPRCILVYPLLSGNKIRGVIELGTLNTISGNHLTFLEKVSESIAITLHSLAIRNRTNVLLEKTQKQAEQLGSHQEELREANSELEENTKALKASEAKLQAQQEELQQTNEELEEQTLRLEEQKNDIEKKNTDLELAGKQIEEKAHDLEMSSKYKSEFLANMSHELRTPLNSILLLSRLLVDNSTGNLKEDQVESAKSVYESGSELLTLINEILDLSKVESGKIELFLEPVEIKEFCFTMDYNFKQLAKEKGLKWNLELEEGLPTHIYTDAQRSKQIVTNFISNAFKFTTKGSVTLRIGRPHTHLEAGRTLAPETLDIKKGIAFTVSDTGAGIPEEKQKIIFEAFQQADGTTSRKYGGTGLGLSISRELAKLLQGEIHMKSTPGKGSTFALYLPETIKKEEQDNKDIQKENYARRQPELRAPGTIGRNSRQKYVEAIEDDRKSLTPQDKSVLIIEDDPTFLKVLRDLAREHGFKCVLAGDGETGLHSTDLYNPSAIILDIGLPRIDGWGVMARLKENPKTRHIPVHFISAADKTIEALKMGAIDFLTKPVNPEMLEKVYEKLEKTISKPVKELLIVEDNKQQADAIEKIIGAGDIHISKATSASEALEQLENGDFDCLILDLGLPDKSGVELLDNIRNNPEIKQLPIIVYTGMELSKEQKTIIDRYAESTIIKSANSHQRLLDETTLFLHRVEADMPSEQQKIMRMLHDKETILSGKRILVVDDDMRNVFSLKKVLSEKGIEVLVGKNGKEGLDVLENNPEIDLVLMDIMMPVMDGYEAIAGIRNQQKFADLPVIALTAKAMKGDRSKCIEVGASDYLAKPVDTDRLFSMLRVWLY